MPTPLDRALNSKNLFLAFGALVTATAAFSIWGQDMFPAEVDPTGDPTKWTEEEMRTWLRKRNLHPQAKDTKAQLLERIQVNMRIARK